MAPSSLDGLLAQGFELYFRVDDRPSAEWLAMVRNSGRLRMKNGRAYLRVGKAAYRAASDYVDTFDHDGWKMSKHILPFGYFGEDSHPAKEGAARAVQFPKRRGLWTLPRRIIGVALVVACASASVALALLLTRSGPW